MKSIALKWSKVLVEVYDVKFIFRLCATAVFLLASSAAGYSQPPVLLVGLAEKVCEADSQLQAHGSCPVLPPTSDGTKAVTVPTPKGFEATYAVAARDDERGDGYYVFGEVAGRSEAPYLAFAPEGGLSVPESWEFFTGRGLSGSTNWVSFNRWQRHTDSDGLWNPGERAKVFSPQKSCGKFQVEWNAPLGRWLMLYGCESAVWVRVSQKASGPWSEATLISDLSSQGSDPVLLPQLDAAGPDMSDSRTTAIHWITAAGHDGAHQVLRAVLRQEGLQ